MTKLTWIWYQEMPKNDGMILEEDAGPAGVGMKVHQRKAQEPVGSLH